MGGVREPEVVSPKTAYMTDEQLSQRALLTLRKVFKNDKAEWTCDEQRQGTLALLKLKTDALVIMRTGTGKTMLPVIASLMEPDYVTVVVLPLKSLMTDYKKRFHEMGIAFEHFDGRQSDGLSGEHNLILVSADIVKTAHWVQSLAELNTRMPVARLVFDEGHMFGESNSFRDSMQNPYGSRILPAQFAVMSGTVPVPMVKEIFDMFGLKEDTFVLRMASSRPEIKIVLEDPRGSDKAIKRVVQIMGGAIPEFDSRDRALVYVPYIKEGKKMAEALGCEFYQGGLGPEERQRIHDNWLSGRHVVMVCTAAFGPGNDHQFVRVVAHAGTPKRLLEYFQEICRGGRDGMPAVAYIIPVSRVRPMLAPGAPDTDGQQAMYDLMFDGSRDCLRYRITLFCDGVGTLCKAHDAVGGQHCSRCKPTVPAHANPPRKNFSNALAGPSHSGPSHSSGMNLRASPPVHSMFQRQDESRLKRSRTEANLDTEESVSAAAPSSRMIQGQHVPSLKRWRTEADLDMAESARAAAPASRMIQGQHDPSRKPSHGQRFFDVAKMAKNRKAASERDKNDYVENFKRALSQVGRICSFCWVHGVYTAWHDCAGCPTLAMKKYGGGSFLSFCRKLKYDPNHHEKICYHCHIPQSNDRLHPTFHQDRNTCEYPDTVSGVGFAILRDGDLREEAGDYYKVRWETESDFTDWLASSPVEGHKTNLTALFLWFSDRPEVVARGCASSQRRLGRRFTLN